MIAPGVNRLLLRRRPCGEFLIVVRHVLFRWKLFAGRSYILGPARINRSTTSLCLAHRIHSLCGSLSILMKLALLILFFTVLCVLSGYHPLQAAAPPTKVVVTTGSQTEREAALYVARDRDFFRRYGVDVALVH